jgi:Ca2+-binding RTX toxin-like protein
VPVHPRLVIALFLLVVASAAGAGFAAGVAGDPCWNATIRGTAGSDVLRGTAGDDVIAGGGGNDVLIGGAGDDLLCGGPGRDKLRGQAGDDSLFGGDDERVVADTDYYEWAGDTLSGGPGDDVLDAGFDQLRHDLGETGTADRITYVGSASGVHVDLMAGRATGEGEDTIVGPVHDVTGSRYDDVLLGTDASDEFESSAGSDRVEGRGGNDFISDSNSNATTSKPQDELGTTNTLLGGPGNDFIQCGSGDDEIRGGSGNDNLSGGYGVDRISGGPGNDQLSDMFDIRPGHRLDGGSGTDTLGEFFLYVPADMKNHDAQTDNVGIIDLADGSLTTSIRGVPVRVPLISIENTSSGYGTWTMIGTDGPNEFITSDENRPVRIFAGGGNDQMMGSFKHDVLDGGAGHDTDLATPGRDERVSIETVRR